MFGQKPEVPSQKKVWLTSAKFALALVILFALVKTSQVNLVLLLNFIYQPLILLSIVAIFVGVLLINTLRWYLLNSSQGIHLSLKKTFVANAIGAAFNNLLPSSIGGDLLRCYYVCKKIPEKQSAILLTIFFDRVIGLMGIMLNLTILAIFRFQYFFHHPRIFYLLFMTLIVGLGSLLTFMALMIFPRIFRFHHWLGKRFPENKIVLFVVACFKTFYEYRIPKKTLFQCLAISLIVQMAIVESLVLAGHGLHFTPTFFSEYAVAGGITQLVSLIPITPGGIGLGEAAFGNILQLLDGNNALAYGTIFLAYRIITTITYLPGFLFLLPKFKSDEKELGTPEISG